ncbi:hypothetical protein AX774_g1843 [Zancudomyces culisetae]|uniref:Uncharacterized protein n=1 Tax=Zancudomyces culisetae TaxID=1213189 RepID=A0A1R1PUI7_ZANCU|nr:hypothetical protein AX774_g1843 [Zancudomyces culisetae]|eukprot:OMH84631.1 hypothetical protein AX774_g1843 [Zancudomyces culisetae]
MLKRSTILGKRVVNNIFVRHSGTINEHQQSSQKNEEAKEKEKEKSKSISKDILQEGKDFLENKETGNVEKKSVGRGKGRNNVVEETPPEIQLTPEQAEEERKLRLEMERKVMRQVISEEKQWIHVEKDTLEEYRPDKRSNLYILTKSSQELIQEYGPKAARYFELNRNKLKQEKQAIVEAVKRKYTLEQLERIARLNGVVFGDKTKHGSVSKNKKNKLMDNKDVDDQELVKEREGQVGEQEKEGVLEAKKKKKKRNLNKQKVIEEIMKRVWGINMDIEGMIKKLHKWYIAEEPTLERSSAKSRKEDDLQELLKIGNGTGNGTGKSEKALKTKYKNKLMDNNDNGRENNLNKHIQVVVTDYKTKSKKIKLCWDNYDLIKQKLDVSKYPNLKFNDQENSIELINDSTNNTSGGGKGKMITSAEKEILKIYRNEMQMKMEFNIFSSTLTTSSTSSKMGDLAEKRDTKKHVDMLLDKFKTELDKIKLQYNVINNILNGYDNLEIRIINNPTQQDDKAAFIPDPDPDPDPDINDAMFVELAIIGSIVVGSAVGNDSGTGNPNANPLRCIDMDDADAAISSAFGLDGVADTVLGSPIMWWISFGMGMLVPRLLVT